MRIGRRRRLAAYEGGPADPLRFGRFLARSNALVKLYKLAPRTRRGEGLPGREWEAAAGCTAGRRRMEIVRWEEREGWRRPSPGGASCRSMTPPGACRAATAPAAPGTPPPASPRDVSLPGPGRDEVGPGRTAGEGAPRGTSHSQGPPGAGGGSGRDGRPSRDAGRGPVVVPRRRDDVARLRGRGATFRGGAPSGGPPTGESGSGAGRLSPAAGDGTPPRPEGERRWGDRDLSAVSPVSRDESRPTPGG